MALARSEAAPHAAIVLDAEGVGVARGGRDVVVGVSFRLRSGEALEITGPNGAGKSSLLRALAGFVPVSAGRLTLHEGAGEAPIAERAHFYGHLDGLKGALSAADNLAFSASLLGGGGPRAFAAAAALDQLGLAHVLDLPVAYLSAGQRRRVALARLLVASRPLWLLDEPATALDAEARESLTRLMQAHLDGGGLIVAATHVPLGLAAARRLRLGA